MAARGVAPKTLLAVYRLLTRKRILYGSGIGQAILAKADRVPRRRATYAGMPEGPFATPPPPQLSTLEAACAELGFTMPSERGVGALLRTLTASKPGGRFLELGTGVGLSLAWMLDGADAAATLTSLDDDADLIALVRAHLGDDARLTLICGDGGVWLEECSGPPFDLVFADTWPGKYTHLERALALVAPGGFYVVDDMREQPNWPEGHAAKAARLLEALAGRDDFFAVRLDWATGVVVLVRRG